MFLAYIDEVAEPGAFVSKQDRRYNGSPAFGYAGFVIRDDRVRDFSRIFSTSKRKLFWHEISKDEADPGRWERKGSDIFTLRGWEEGRRQIEGYKKLVRELVALDGRLFFYGEEKQLGTATERWGKDSRDQKKGRLEFERRCLRETLNRLCTFAEAAGQNLIVIMDSVNEKERKLQVQDAYSHIFSRSTDPEHAEMTRLVEATMHVDSQVSANIQFADWIAASVRRAFEYQLLPGEQFDWVPRTLGELMQSCITRESKLYLDRPRAGRRELYHSQVFSLERILLSNSVAHRLPEIARQQMAAMYESSQKKD